MARDINVKITGDASDLERALGRAHGASSRLSGVMKAGLRTAAIGAGAAIGGLAIAAKIGFDELMEAQKVTAQTNAVLKSTGGAANVTAKQVDALANSIAAYSGADDEAVKSAENMLLTFTKVRNESGKGNDIFNQATASILDMSTAMSIPLKSATIQVGKALNDPIKNLGKLQRAGVDFSAAQVKVIKRLAETGDLAGAQKLILRELNREFGGSAKAFGDTVPGALAKLKEAFKNSAASVLEAWLPLILKIAQVALPAITSAMEKASAFMQGPFRQAMEVVIEKGKLIAAWFQENVIPVIMKLKDIFMDSVTAIAAVLKAHEPELRRIWDRVSAAISNLAKVILPILRLWFTKILPVAIGIAITYIDKVSAVIETVATVTKTVVGKVTKWWNQMTDAMKVAFRGVGNAINAVWEGIKGAFISAINWIAGKLNAFIATVNGVIGKLNAIPGVNIPKVPSVPTIGGHQFSGDFSGEHGRTAARATGRPADIVIQIDGREIVRAVQEVDRTHRRGNGGSGVFA